MVGMLVFLYIDSAEQLSEASVSAELDDPPPERSEVVEVIDGMTIKLASGHKVRYLGVRMPNVRQKVECYGKESLAMNESVIGKTVRLEGDPILDRAEDGAWLRYVYAPEAKKENIPDEESASGSDAPINEEEASGGDDNIDGDAPPAIGSTEVPIISVEEEYILDEEGSESEKKQAEGDEEEDAHQGAREGEYMINERIIEIGAGFPLLSEEMIYFDRMASGMRYSQATEKGLWGTCELETPKGGLPITNTVEECVIKGKVLINGDKVYREPGCAAYGRTVVLQYSKGDAWLCSKEEAEEGGWQRAKDC